MTSSTTRAFMAKKQSTSFAQVANNLLNVLQGYTKSIRLLLVMFLTLTVSAEVWGETWTWTASAGGELGSKNGTVTLDGKSWNVSRSSWTQAGTMNNGCIQVGSKNNPTSLTLGTDDFAGYTITKIDVVCSSYNGNHNITMLVGSNTFYSTTSTPSGDGSSAAKVSGTGNAAGTISISFTQKSSAWRAMYIKSISVTYETVAATFPVTGVSLNKTELILTEGDSETLTATITPANATDKTVTWSTDKSSVATVSNGKVTAVAAGNATITVTTTDGGKTATCNVTVNPKPKYTVTLEAGPGTCDASVTEISAGAGVTLPTPTLSSACQSEGWSFAGWKTTSAVTTETTTEPTLIPAGAYSPTSDITLYAVYQRTETTSGGGGGESHSITITPNTFTDKGSNNYGSGAERIGSENAVSFGGHYITGNVKNTPSSGAIAGTYLQCQANNATIYNKTELPGKITKIVVNQYEARAFSLYCGKEQLVASNNTNTGVTPSGTKITDTSSATTMTWNVSGDYTFFAIKKGSNAGYVTSIVITYQTDGGQSETTYYHSTPDCGSTEPSVSFDLNGGSGTFEPEPLDGDSYTIPGTVPTRDGYNFAGWKINGEGNLYQPEAIINNITESITLVAQWTAKTITITWDANGGSVTPESSTYTYNGATITTLPTPTRTGYSFNGWFTEASSGTQITEVGTTNKPTEDVTYYAQWTKLHTITWKVNGEEYIEGTPTISVEDGNAITHLPTAPDEAPSGCSEKVFVGWTDSEISEETDIKPTTLFTDAASAPAIDGDKTFHAVFADEEGDNFSLGQSGDFKIYANVNDIYHYAKEDAAVDKIPSTPDSNEATIYTFTKETIDGEEYYSIYNGSKYIGYNSSTNLKETAEAEKQYWSIEKGTHGSWRVTSKNTSTRALAYRANEYDTFRAYSTGNIDGNEYYDIEIGGGTSYSAYTTTCDANNAKVTYDLNGGEYESDDCVSQTVTKGQPFNLCSNTPTKEGYTFAGWTDGVNTYAAGATVTVNESTTFYAKWTAKTITITWDQNYTDCPEAATSTYIYDGEEIAMPAEPIRTGYKFTGWFTDATDGTQVTEVGETNKPTADVTYYAHWAQLYTVTFRASGQVYVVQEDKYLSGANLELPADPSPANYACDGYIFEGWSADEKTEDATKPELISNPTITNDETYYAVWKKATTEGAGETIFYESFSGSEGTGGNDNQWSGYIATAEAYVDNDGWSGENVSGADQCIKLGTGDKKGSVTTPELSQLGGNATLSFKAAAWNGSSESTTLVLSIEGGGSLSKTSVTLTKGAWQSYEVTITGGTSSTRIIFAGKNTSNSRFFLDEVKVTTSGSYNYTTSPSCGPTIVAKDGMWVTSANSQSVKVNVPIAIKSFTTNATITGTTANSNFVVTTLENIDNGEHNLVVTYTPNASDIKEDATITLTAKVGEETISTTTFTINGRSLPDEFAIVVDKASEYFALPANMPSAGTYPGYSVTLNAGSVTSAPKTHLYTAQAVHNTRFAENGTALRLVGNNNACLWATNAVSGTDIRNYAQLDNAKTADYEWNLYTEDGDTYRISCSIVTEEGRILRMYGANFGMYKSGAEVFYLLPVECTSTPTNMQVSPARVSATISWENAATCDLQVLKEGTPVQTISGAVSPVVVTGLTELTAYTFTLTPTDAASCKVDGAFTTTGPDIDIVEWMTDGMIIQVDKDDAVNPSVVINGEVEYNTGSGVLATELFFSKYFEAHGENKLLAIYNGTGAPIDLSGYEIKSENGALDLSQFGQTKGQVAPNEEIILVYYDVDYSAEECAEQQEGYENWNILTEKSVLAFSGRGSIGLYKDDVLIDVIGSTFPSGELTKIGKSGKPDYCGTEDDVRLYVDGFSVNDQSSFFCDNGDNIKTDEEENNYAISTNRCLLIRKNSVTSGANAVANNKADDDATCGYLSTTFTTLCSEWSGFRIGGGKSSDEEIREATCDGLGYVGGFDYSKYYREYQQIGDSKKLDEFVYNEDENLYKITIDPLSNYSCLNVSVELFDPETDELLTQQVAQVPIIVASENTTTDELFSNIVEGELGASKTRCSTCDVVILKDATLTKAAAETDNDVNQVRNIYIYPGGKLIVPAEGNDYSVNSLSLRRVEDEVSMASVQTPLLITSSAANPIYVDVRVNSENWHWFTLPYNCNIADVTWADGTPAKYNVDWFLMWYDGESRSNQKSNYESHWKVYEGTTLEAGKGYIVGITGHPTKSKVKYELRFPMAQGVLTAEKTDKTVAVNAWGVKKDIRPNHKGWNLVGNPYMDYYNTASSYSLGGLPLIKYADTYDPITGLWDYEESGSVPFLVIPQDGGMSEYKQELASDVDMLPFTAYFVQVGDPANGGHSNGMKLNASFDADKRGRSSLIRRAPSEVDEQEEPAIVAVELTNAKGESDKTTLLIADRFTNEYEMNADFFKWFGDYYTYYTKPVLYTIGADSESRAFNALNEELAAQPVALGMYAAQAGNYTFSLHQRSNLTGVAEVWLHDASNNTHTNLLQDDYTFSTSKTNGAGRFSLSVKMMPKLPTDVENIKQGNVWATTQGNNIVINGLTKDMQLWIYDATGKLLHADRTTNYQHSYSVPQTGAYFVRVHDKNDAQTIKVVVE